MGPSSMADNGNRHVDPKTKLGRRLMSANTAKIRLPTIFVNGKVLVDSEVGAWNRKIEAERFAKREAKKRKAMQIP